MEALWNFGYNEVVDSSRTWTSNRYHVAMQSHGGGGAFVGRFVGLRVRLNDGWHYGWLRLAEYSGTSASGTAYESYFPGAYALETEPDTSIRTPLCPLDVNMDGVISTEDYFAYLEYFAEGDYRARWSPYDPLDNQVDFFDYLDFLSAFLAGC